MWVEARGLQVTPVLTQDGRCLQMTVLGVGSKYLQVTVGTYVYRWRPSLLMTAGPTGSYHFKKDCRVRPLTYSYRTAAFNKDGRRARPSLPTLPGTDATIGRLGTLAMPGSWKCEEPAGIFILYIQLSPRHLLFLSFLSFSSALLPSSLPDFLGLRMICRSGSRSQGRRKNKIWWGGVPVGSSGQAV